MRIRTSLFTNTENRPRVVPLSPGKSAIPLMEEPLPEQGSEEDDDLEPLVSPRHRELVQQKVKLTSGVEMELRWALGNLEILRLTQDKNSEEFKALVSIGKPRGARSLPSDVSAEAIGALTKRGHIQSDGTLRPDLAAVLDAAYKETDEGAVLVDPVIYPTRAIFDEFQQHQGEALTQLGRLAMKAAKRDEKDGKGNKGDKGGQSP